jgi:DNA-binding winged helix-turn-helix (wHTH) protein/Tol biopolymer transport system component
MTVRSPVRFGTYELDLQAGVLRKNGVRLRCQEQPLQVLAALAERPGELVTREELRRRVWPQDTFVDFDHALNTAVKKIRATLNDDADAPRYIETVPRRGYRFVAAVEEVCAPSPEIPSPAAVATKHRLLPLIAVVVVVLAVAGVGWKLSRRAVSDPAPAVEFQRLTFDLPELGDARFTPDGASVVFSGGGHSHNATVYTQRIGASGPQALRMLKSVLLAVSRQGELAVLAEGARSPFAVAFKTDAGTLARVTLGGGAPRELLADVEAADWSPDGQLAVVRRVGHRSRLEFPIGKVLYQSAGWIASPRFSPSGDAIAFVDHPTIPDDRGSVDIVDLNGARKTLSGFWESVRGLAWNPQNGELWFAATRSGVSRTLYAVTRGGRERRVLSVAGGLSLQDIASDGRVLLARDNESLGIVFMGAGDTQPRDLSWKDWSIAMDISRDGKQLLFGEEGEDSGFSYQVGLRPTDGSPPVILGSGTAQSLSPDGKWALSVMPPPDDQLVLLPVGPGTQKTLERGSVEHYQFAGARWFADSRRIVFVASEAGHGPRCYEQSIEAGPPRAITPEGMLLCNVSPDGRVLALADDRRAVLYRSDSSSQPEKEFRLAAGEIPSAWTADGKYLYLVQTQRTPATITRLEIASGRRQLWRQLPPPPGGGEMKNEAVVITPDGQSYAYTYSQHVSDLYLVQGLK